MQGKKSNQCIFLKKCTGWWITCIQLFWLEIKEDDFISNAFGILIIHRKHLSGHKESLAKSHELERAYNIVIYHTIPKLDIYYKSKISII